MNRQSELHDLAENTDPVYPSITGWYTAGSGLRPRRLATHQRNYKRKDYFHNLYSTYEMANKFKQSPYENIDYEEFKNRLEYNLDTYARLIDYRHEFKRIMNSQGVDDPTFLPLDLENPSDVVLYPGWQKIPEEYKILFQPERVYQLNKDWYYSELTDFNSRRNKIPRENSYDPDNNEEM